MKMGRACESNVRPDFNETRKAASCLPRFFVLASLVIASCACANTPPVTPPEPARLAAAVRLVAALPLETSILVNASDVSTEVATNALAWLATQRSQRPTETIKQIFYEKVRIESRDHLPAAIGDARAVLAENYARRMSESDLEGSLTFAASPAGKAFLEVELSSNTEARSLTARFLYKRLFADLPTILQSARDAGHVLERVNRRR